MIEVVICERDRLGRKTGRKVRQLSIDGKSAASFAERQILKGMPAHLTPDVKAEIAADRLDHFYGEGEYARD